MEADGPERSRALSICIVMRWKRLGRVEVLVVLVVLSSVGREFEDLAACVGCGRTFADVVDSPAVVCARATEMRFGADMVVVFCDEIC